VTQAESGPVEISGFFDMLNKYGRLADGEKSLQFNQVELDINHQVTDKLAAAASVCYNDDAGAFGIGAAYADYQFLKAIDSKGWRPERAGFIAGQFDIPFGIDYLTCCSNLRKTVSVPMIVTMTHGGWNDVGAQLYAGNKFGNITAYAVNGFADQATDTNFVWNLEASDWDETVETVDITPKQAFGGRLGIRPSSKIDAEFGSSLALGLNNQHRTETYLYGFDGSMTIAAATLKGEYIYHSRNRSRQAQANYGYYVQGEYQLGKLFLVSRFDNVAHKELGKYRRETLGAGYAFGNGFELRFEYQHPDINSSRAAIAQLVVAM